jgi:hypothetical protein
MKVQTFQEMLLESVEEYLNKKGRSLYVKTSNPSQPPEHQTSSNELSVSEQPISDIQNQES